MESEYYILEEGERVGPFTPQQLMDRPLEPDDMVLLPSENQGVPAYSLPEFKMYFKSEGIYYPNKENTASYFLRLPAYLIDAFIISIGLEILAVVLFPGYIMRLQGTFNEKFFRDPELVQNLAKYRTEIMIIQVIWFVTMILYHTFCESSRIRASVGKYVVGLAVVDELGYSLSFGQAFKRNAAKMLYLIMGFLLGFLSYIAYLRIIWGDRHQAIHDRFAGCYIVSKK